ncbi:MAG: YCF48-related protein [Thermodesulfobacteriota bacterium]
MVRSACQIWVSAVAVVITGVLLCMSGGCGHGGAEAEITEKLDRMGKSKGLVFPDKEDYYGAFVLDENNAWVVGNRGVVLHIANQGEQITLLPTGVEKAIYNIDFIDPQNGLAIGQDGLILKTADGGKTWKQVKLELPLQEWQAAQPHIFAMSRGTDPNKVWAVGPAGTVIHSEDGGETWQNLSLGRDVTLNGVSFVSDTEGWVVGEFGTILHTADGGKTWEEQKNVLNLPKYTRPELSEEEALRQRVPPLYLDDLFLVAVNFRNPQEGYVAAESGILLKTEDGGQTWTNVPSGSFNTLLSVLVTPAGQGIATGILGTIAVAQDGQWTLIQDVRGHVLTWIRDASFAKDGRFGIAVGGKGTILMTRDGGRTWKRVGEDKLKRAAVLAPEKAA